MLIDKLQSCISPKLVLRILEHPLNEGLRKGTLPFITFRYMLAQDKLYLDDFSKALGLAAAYTKNPFHQQILRSESLKALETQKNLHNKYLEPILQLPFFGRTAQLTPVCQEKIPILVEYGNFMSRSASLGGIIEIFPCFYFYNLLGHCMRAQPVANNPYQLWVDSYASPRFSASTEAIAGIINEVAYDASVETIAEMQGALMRSTHYEIAFWDAIYYGAEAVPAPDNELATWSNQNITIRG